jgi:hypothetical protein
MFIFDTDRIPQTAAELTAAITAFLQSWIQLPSNAKRVTIAGKPPALGSLAIDVSGGMISPANPPTFAKVEGTSSPGPSANAFAIVGHPISIADIPLQFDLTASNAVFAYGRTTDQRLIATLQDASDGKLSLHISDEDLESAALLITRHFAGNSVIIQKLDIALTSVSPTELNVLLTITAKKFVSAIVRVFGRIHIDDQLVATATNLKADAEGMVGAIAANMLRPHLAAIESKPLPLMTFSLGNVKIRDVKIDTADGLQISAAFGSGRA